MGSQSRKPPERLLDNVFSAILWKKPNAEELHQILQQQIPVHRNFRLLPTATF